MKLLASVLALAAGLLAGCTCCGNRAADRTVSLFNGRDLAGWVVMHGGEWRVEDGVLVGRNGVDWTTNPERSGSWLRTEKEYGDFTLEFEYAIQGNSGVFLRSGLDRNPAFTGQEMQILADHGREPRKSTTGALYDVVAPSRNLSRPTGQWNEVRIDCQGRRIQIMLNGEKVVDHRSDRRTRGYLGLQNHDTNSVVRFRNLRLTER
ncbi:MAG: FK506-binding protein [Verrucomicrobiota bacterium]|jgi:hypothetical protein